ncbi:hypothetical protein BKH43_06445 [Helicobacter sp. 13S00401-1]|uniref:GspE/PulE family protein n=1 Tax=Helicobacter sp. 13S00401-1 TaxID=1905758 RepID=UPI000BA5A3B0|nr:ATPase, T2SS/T4P/T4SS family [Helicobacter sp. 13S00401-1]PAF49725.1 hypothetical protein BKH43_06445 [Helicobacter sp. 13S00401-1]
MKSQPLLYEANPYTNLTPFLNLLDEDRQKDLILDLLSKDGIDLEHFLESNLDNEALIFKALKNEGIEYIDIDSIRLVNILILPQEFLPAIVVEVLAQTKHLKLIAPNFLNHFHKLNITQSINDKFKDYEIDFCVCSHYMLKKINIALKFKYESKEVSIASLLSYASLLNASDIHLVAKGSKASFYIRLEGILHFIRNLELGNFLSISKQLKLLSNVDITNRFNALDGHFNIEVDSKTLDIRSSFLFLKEGESIVLRLPSLKTKSFTFKDLGLDAKFINLLKDSLEAKSGLILISGPTGSGKTTTLYTCLEHINKGAKKIVTIEDPVEKDIEGISQCEVKENFGFEVALKYVLRQDPDVIMIGEIRDKETLALALMAALSGHLVLASIHSSSVFSIIQRLRNLGAKKHVLKATLRLFISQRLLMTKCLECDGRGCISCYFSGLGKRKLINEYLPFTPSLDSIMDSVSLLENFFQTSDIPSLEVQAHELFKKGIITKGESLI